MDTFDYTNINLTVHNMYFTITSDEDIHTSGLKVVPHKLVKSNWTRACSDVESAIRRMGETEYTTLQK